MREPVFPGAILKQYAPGDRALQPRIDKLVLHSTETVGLPGYQSGYTAPNLTVDPWTGKTWQHWDSVARSTKTLRDTGGFPENRDNVSQIEIVGYSDANLGRPRGRYLPDLDEAGLVYLAGVLAWYHREWDLPLIIPGRWPAYPASYGATIARMTPAEFDAYRGVLGHLHVPDNVHGDPTINIGRILELAGAATPPAVELVAPAPAPSAPARLAVDGVFGPATKRALQRWLGVTVDDGVSPVTRKALQRRLGVRVDGVWGPVTVRALQRLVGARPDGVWGPETTKALQRHLNAQGVAL